MRIEIYRSEKKPLKIILPTALIFNPVGFAISKGLIKISGADIPISPKDMGNISRAIKRCKGLDPEWCLLEAESDGNVVKIKL